jgi:hypothetical protein
MTDPDAAHRTWLRRNLDRAAANLGVAVTAEPVYG